MYCRQCGQQIPNNAAVCPSCGEPIDTGLKVCALLFVNLIAGILLLCMED